ncbi:polyprenyl diphosphate synthase [Oligella urethralis]|uniref:Isoprenyl transferase n=2 Tax=Oligella urethralis TaxID=90245 RepID=A0A095Z6P7_9BURK|nr:polyprenyl diphosphate synthase [Oligella urethralis]AVL70995.1 di-trans,poly-cis-decaprenylcistransferase [Oligella urethralis]KGF30016.1 UDP diphosphate synthase [Oligella urethralis DNF00040]SPY08555.1 Undecaprenyl pyrophosphate synthase [Oligella urethralis]SUA67157.1 Undecaprenyl pyrophosphate synthase [Oligella urethralis]
MISSTQAVPAVSAIPQHLAVVMDGNGRWATERHLPRTAGHIRGVNAVRRIVRYCGDKGIKYLTLFSFSSENWRRPKEEVDLLMRLFLRSLQKEVNNLHKNGIRLRVVGDISAFSPQIQHLIAEAEERTKDNDLLHLTIAANYGGRWDILTAFQRYMQAHGTHPDTVVDEAVFDRYLSMAWAPEPDLFIRTGGEQRISNFLIWQLAYTELYFTSTYWPDIKAEHLDEALAWYAGRERRFGQTSAQLLS